MSRKDDDLIWKVVLSDVQPSNPLQLLTKRETSSIVSKASAVSMDDRTHLATPFLSWKSCPSALLDCYRMILLCQEKEATLSRLAPRLPSSPIMWIPALTLYPIPSNARVLGTLGRTIVLGASGAFPLGRSLTGPSFYRDGMEASGQKGSSD